MDLLDWRRRKLVYEERERKERAGRVTIGDATPWHAGVQEQVNRDILARLEVLEGKLAFKGKPILADKFEPEKVSRG